MKQSQPSNIGIGADLVSRIDAFWTYAASNGGGKVALQNVVQTLGPSVGRHANSTSLPNSAPVIDVLNESHYVFDGKELIDEHCDSDSSITASISEEEDDLDYPDSLSPNLEIMSEHPSGQSRRTSTSSITATFDSSTALSFTTANISGRGWDADRSAEETTMSRILSPTSTAATSRRSSFASTTPSRFLRDVTDPSILPASSVKSSRRSSTASLSSIAPSETQPSETPGTSKNNSFESEVYSVDSAASLNTLRVNNIKNIDNGGRTPLSFISTYASPQIPAANSAIKSALRMRSTDSSRKVSFLEQEEDNSMSKDGSSVRDRSRSSFASTKDGTVDKSVSEDGDHDEDEEQEVEDLMDDGGGDADIEDADSVANNEESVSGSGSGSGSRRSSESTNKSYGTASVRSSKSNKSARSPNTQLEMSFVASEVDIVAESSSPPHGDDDFGELEQEQEQMSVSRRKSISPEKRSNSSVGTPSSDARYRTMTLSTPGSNDFTRGYIDQDETYTTALDRTEGEEIDTDREEDFDSSRVSNKSGPGNLTGITDVSGLREDGASFLHTISPSNKKYIKNNPQALDALKQKEALRKNVKGKKRELNSDEDEDGDRKGEGDNEDGEMEEEDDNTEEEEEDSISLRRSKRVTKGKRFAFWKGERPVYNQGTMVGLLTAEPTPKKQKKPSTNKSGRRSNEAVKKLFKRGSQEENEVDHVENAVGSIEEEDRDGDGDDMKVDFKLPTEYQFMPRDESEWLNVWDESVDAVRQTKVVCAVETLQPAAPLPRTAKRAKGKEGVGFAASSFNVPEVPGLMSGWTSGFMELPPEAIKDAEGVGRFSQVFFVSDCQDQSVELGIADPSSDSWRDESAQRMLLKKGDSFFVPPGNVYRLENHSRRRSCKMFWTIIKPLETGTVDEIE